jgi:hypothetical protein
MVLEIGKIYKLRNGLITEPIELSKNGTNYKFSAKVKEPQHKDKSVLSWMVNGKSLTNNIEYKYDIIEEIN